MNVTDENLSYIKWRYNRMYDTLNIEYEDFVNVIKV